MKQYLELLEEVTQGVVKEDRTGVGTVGVFGKQIKIDLEDGFPLLTTKKMYFKGIVEELLMFLRGDTNTKNLEEKGVNIWKGNTSREFLDKVGLDYLPEGEMGCSYSHQWRNFGGEHPLVPLTKGLRGFDQLADVLDKLKNNPFDRRMIINGWCPSQSEYMALPPCHILYVFYYNPEKNSLNCSLTQRSVDTFLGLPFNLASQALLTHILAKYAGMNLGELSWTGVDVHAYKNHLGQISEQLNNCPMPLPKLFIKKELPDIQAIEDLQFSDFDLTGYNPYPAIKAPMAV